jgi:SAM-dependent methyltransferase
MRLFADWQDAAFAAEWMARDVLKDLLDLPRRIASIVVGQDRTPARVADIGSGPGDFLARFLEDFPAVHGTWTDASDAMMQTARARLARFGDRVDYRILCMEDLAALPDDLDVVLTSRVTHHLSPGRTGRLLRGRGSEAGARRMAGQPRPHGRARHLGGPAQVGTAGPHSALSAAR